MRDRESERERERGRQTDRETDRQRDRETHVPVVRKAAHTNIARESN